MRVMRVALLIQLATRMRHIVTSFVAPLDPHIFGHYIVNGPFLGGKKDTERKICVLIFSITFV
jgi:hypothetical protein